MAPAVQLPVWVCFEELLDIQVDLIHYMPRQLIGEEQPQEAPGTSRLESSSAAAQPGTWILHEGDDVRLPARVQPPIAVNELSRDIFGSYF